MVQYKGYIYAKSLEDLKGHNGSWTNAYDEMFIENVGIIDLHNCPEFPCCLVRDNYQAKMPYLSVCDSSDMINCAMDDIISIQEDLIRMYKEMEDKE